MSLYLRNLRSGCYIMKKVKILLHGLKFKNSYKRICIIQQTPPFHYFFIWFCIKNGLSKKEKGRFPDVCIQVGHSLFNILFPVPKKVHSTGQPWPRFSIFIYIHSSLNKVFHHKTFITVLFMTVLFMTNLS